MDYIIYIKTEWVVVYKLYMQSEEHTDLGTLHQSQGDLLCIGLSRTRIWLLFHCIHDSKCIPLLLAWRHTYHIYTYNLQIVLYYISKMKDIYICF